MLARVSRIIGKYSHRSKCQRARSIPSEKTMWQCFANSFYEFFYILTCACMSFIVESSGPRGCALVIGSKLWLCLLSTAASEKLYREEASLGSLSCADLVRVIGPRVPRFLEVFLATPNSLTSFYTKAGEQTLRPGFYTPSCPFFLNIFLSTQIIVVFSCFRGHSRL